MQIIDIRKIMPLFHLIMWFYLYYFWSHSKVKLKIYHIYVYHSVFGNDDHLVKTWCAIRCLFHNQSGSTSCADSRYVDGCKQLILTFDFWFFSTSLNYKYHQKIILTHHLIFIQWYSGSFLNWTLQFRNPSFHRLSDKLHQQWSL